MDQVRVRIALSQIGYVLLHLQLTESTIKRVMQIAMPQERDLFVTVTERIESKKMNRPLGPFLTELRKRAELHADVDQLLSDFLTRRNEFIHHITKPKGWTLSTPEGLEVVGKQLKELHESSKKVRTIFTALLYSWKVQDELEPTAEEVEAFAALEGKYEGGVMRRKWGIDG